MTDRTCARCGVSIAHRGKLAMTCSNRCQESYRLARRRAEREAIVRVCEICGAGFSSPRIEAPTCSKNCSRLRWYRNNREKSIATTRAWQAANAERWAESKRAWGLANTERKRDALRRFYAANPLAATVYSNRRRDAKLTQTRGVGVKPRDIERLINRFAGCCAYCGRRPERLHIDHVVPLIRGGSNSIGNLLPACPPCNLSKNRRLLTEWKKQLRYCLAA